MVNFATFADFPFAFRGTVVTDITALTAHGEVTDIKATKGVAVLTGGVDGHGQREIVWDGTLGKGEDVEVTFTYTADDRSVVGQVYEYRVIPPTGMDLAPDSKLRGMFTVTDGDKSSIVLSGTVTNTIPVAGDKTTFIHTVLNQGKAMYMTDRVINLTLPEGCSVAEPVRVGEGYTATVNGSRVTVTGNIGPGVSTNIEIDVQTGPKSSGEIVSTIEDMSGEWDGVQTLKATIIPANPKLNSENTFSVDSPERETDFNNVVVLTNTGNADITEGVNIVYSSLGLFDLTNISVKSTSSDIGTATLNNDTVTLSGVIKPGEKATITTVLAFSAETPDGASVRSSVQVIGDTLAEGTLTADNKVKNKPAQTRRVKK